MSLLDFGLKIIGKNTEVARTRVVNIHKEKCDVYIGRGSIWGNPYEIGKDGDRNTVILKYYDYMFARLKNNPEIKHQLKKLVGKRIGCFCKPKPCHGDILVEFIVNYGWE